MIKARSKLSVFLVLTALLPLAGCADFTYQSERRDRKIVIDGKENEWYDSLELQKNVYFGVRNDSEYLYICLSVTDKKTKAQLMGLFKQRFYIWIVPENAPKNSFGLRISNKSQFMDESMLTKIRYLSVPVFQVIGDEMLNNMGVEIMRDGRIAGPLADAKGIDIAVGVSMDGRKLTYELKVPLAESSEHPYAVGSGPGKTIRIGLATSSIDMSFYERQWEARHNYTQSRNGGRGFVGSNAAPRIYSEPEPVNYVKVWGKIKLSAKP